MQRLTADALESDSEFNDSVTALREQIVEYIKSEKAKDEADQKVKRFDWKGLDNNTEFIKEAFVNKSFQGLLISITSTEQTKTTWSKLIDAITSILSKYKVDVSKSVYAEVVSLVQQKVDYTKLEQPTQDDRLAEEEDLDAEESDELVDEPLTRNARTERRKKNKDLIEAEGSTYQDEISLENAKIGDEFWYEDYVKGRWVENTSKVKDIVDGKIFFENGQNWDNVSAYMNITAEDAWFDKLKPAKKSTTQDKSSAVEEPVTAVEEPVEEIPVEDFDENGPIEGFPKVLLDKLIADYKKAVASGDATGKNIDKLSNESLTKEFKTWVDDYGQQAIQKFKALLVKPIPENISLISNEDKKRLVELGYTAEDINNMSDFEMANIVLKDMSDASLNTDEEEVVNELIDEELNIVNNEKEDSDEEDNANTGGTPESGVTGDGSNKEKTTTEETTGVNKAIHNKVVERLQNGEEVIAEVIGKTGITSARATLDTGENILFYDHNNVVTAADKNEVVSLKLVPKLTLEDGTELTNVVQVYAGDRYMGNLSEKDYKKVKPVLTVNATEQEIQEAAEVIVSNNEKLFTEKKLIKELLKDLGYSKQDIASLKKGQKMKILKNSITKEQYLEKKAKKVSKKSKQQDTLQDSVVNFLDGKFDAVETENELLNVFNEVVNKFPNYTEELPFIKNMFNEQRNTLANQKDFAKLKVGSKLLLSGGRVVKVTAVNDKSVEVVDFNSIIENKFEIPQASFDKQVSKVINDFNKSDKDVVSRLDENNIEQLSSIFSKFTTSAFSVSDTEIADDEMLENFKACK